MAEAQQRAQRQQKQLEISAELAERKEILAVKRELLEQAFAQALSAFSKLPQEEYQELIKAFLEETKDPACQQLVISADEERITPEFLAGLSKRAGLALGATPGGEPKAHKGGFSCGVRKEIDCTIPTLLQLDRAQLESEVAQILFGDLKEGCYNLEGIEIWICCRSDEISGKLPFGKKQAGKAPCCPLFGGSFGAAGRHSLC